VALVIVPSTIKAAQAFVVAHHRHHRAPQGAMWVLAVAADGRLCGVAIVGRPVARMLQDGTTAEITRLCTTGERNACSALYAAATRASKALGYRRLITYTLPAEGGASLRALSGMGWRLIGEVAVESGPARVAVAMSRRIRSRSNTDGKWPSDGDLPVLVRAPPPAGGPEHDVVLDLDVYPLSPPETGRHEEAPMTENAMVPVVSLYGLYVDEMGKGRLRGQLAAARRDADESRKLLAELLGYYGELDVQRAHWRRRAEGQSMARMRAEGERDTLVMSLAKAALEQADAALALGRARELQAQAEARVAVLIHDRDELREAYRRELESNGKLRASETYWRERCDRAEGELQGLDAAGVKVSPGII